jgi:hypothetical protein
MHFDVHARSEQRRDVRLLRRRLQRRKRTGPSAHADERLRRPVPRVPVHGKRGLQRPRALHAERVLPERTRQSLHLPLRLR